jgi:hypothetical protein
MQEVSMDIRDLDAVENMADTEELDYTESGPKVPGRSSSAARSLVSASELIPVTNLDTLLMGNGGGDIVPYTDSKQLVRGKRVGAGRRGEKEGISNPAFSDGNENGGDGYEVGVIPIEQAPVMI